MKRILIVLVIVTLLLCGCGKKETAETQETQERFAVEYQQKLGEWGSLGIIRIIRDTETGKAYLFTDGGYAGGLTVLEEGE